MPSYNITITQVQDDAVSFKATQLSKTKSQIFQDFVIDGLISGWIREMYDAELEYIENKWPSLTQAQKDQMRAIAGV